MKKPKDVQELTNRLMSAATTPLVAPPPALAAPAIEEPVSVLASEKATPIPAKARKAPNRATVSVFLRMHGPLFEEYDKEAVRRTKATGRGVTVQQIILEKLEKARPTV